MSMTLDDLAKQLAAAKKAYNTASPTGLEDIKKQGLQIRSQATGAGYDLNALEDSANKYGGFQVDANNADEKAFRQDRFTAAKAAPVWNDPSKTSVNGAGSPELKVGQDQKVKYSNAWLEDATKLTVQLQKMLDTPFNFNAEADPTYQAAKQLAQAGAKTATRQTLSQMNNRGLVNSSMTTSQLGQIEQQAEMEPMKLIPQLQQNAYSQHQQGIANQGTLLNVLLGTGLDQQKFMADETWKKAATTGSYLDPEAQPILDQLMALKQSAENPLATSEDVRRFSGLADQERSKLSALGIDETKFGSDVSYSDAMKNIGSAGKMTVPMQQALLEIMTQNNQAYGGVPEGFSELVKQYPQFAPLADYFKGYEGKPDLQKETMNTNKRLREKEIANEKIRAEAAASGTPLTYEQQQQMNTDSLVNYIYGRATDKADALKMLDDPEVKKNIQEKNIDAPKLRKAIEESYAADPKEEKTEKPPMDESDVYDYAYKEVMSIMGYQNMTPEKQNELWDQAFEKWSKRILKK